MTLFESARFVTSVASLEDLNRAPLAMLPELAFVGRSNAGKSSVINALANRRQLAYASKTPGRTQLLNFFELSERGAEGRVARAYAVDLPGYGFAKVEAGTRETWDQLAGGYLAGRRYLVGVVLVMDARRPLVAADETLLAWIVQRSDSGRLRAHLLLNKADQLNRAERTAALRGVQARIKSMPIAVTAQLFSARDREGLEELDATLNKIIAEARPG